MTEFESGVLATLARIVELLERREAGKTNLLRIIHRHVGGAAFTASELVRHAALPRYAALQAALDRDFDDPEPRRIGKFLAAIAGRETGGFIVENVGREREGVIWRVRLAEGKPALPVAREENAVMLSARVDGGTRKCG